LKKTVCEAVLYSSLLSLAQR